VNPDFKKMILLGAERLDSITGGERREAFNMCQIESFIRFGLNLVGPGFQVAE
jgi:hypothetical protein